MTRPFSELSQYPQKWPKISGIRRTLREKGPGAEGKETWDSVAILAHKHRCEIPSMSPEQFGWFRDVLDVLKETYPLSHPDLQGYDIEDTLPCGCALQVFGGTVSGGVVQSAKVREGHSRCCKARMVEWCCYCSSGCDGCKYDSRCTKCGKLCVRPQTPKTRK